MDAAVWTIASLAVFAAAIASHVRVYHARPPTLEPFTDADTIGNAVLALYQDVLQRPPTAAEYRANVRDIQSNTLTLTKLRRRLLTSDEYRKLIKTQSDQPAPELRMMLQDHELLAEVAKMYREERRAILPKNMALPLKDVFIYEDFNVHKLRLVLRDPKFAAFQEEVQSTDYLTKEKLLALYAKTFNHTQLDTNAQAMAKAEQAKARAKIGTPTTANGGLTLSTADREALIGSLLGEARKRQAAQGAGKNAAYAGTGAGTLCTTADGKTRIEINGREPYVLRSDQAWSVPQRRPPICIPVGEPAQVQPVVFTRGNLPLTPLKQDTSVGSVRPKFTYTEYADLPKAKADAKADAKA